MILKEKIPPVYHKVLNDILKLTVPDEKIADCSSCNLCLSHKSPYLDLKCCNYFPQLPNFLVGGILTDNDSSLAFGKAKIMELIAAKKGVTPYGISPDKNYSNEQQFFLSDDRPFQSKDEMNLQKCPYYDEGNCSVWKYREHLCVTFFCSSVAGKYGTGFWKKLDELMKLAEQKISFAVLLKMGWKEGEIAGEVFSSDMLDFETEAGGIDEEAYEKLWDSYAGKEADFYIESYRLVQEFDKDTFERISGLELGQLKKDLLEKAEIFKERAYPDFLRLHPDVTIEQTEKGVSRLKLQDEIYDTDSVFIPLIKQFNGSKSTKTNFQTAYQVIFSLNNIVDNLLEKGMLIEVNPQ